MHTTATRTASGQSTQFNDEGEAKDGTRHMSNVSRCTADVGVSHVLELVSLTMAAMDSGDSNGYGGSDGSKDRVSNDAAKSVKDPSGYDDSSWHGAQGLNAWRGWRWVMAAAKAAAVAALAPTTANAIVPSATPASASVCSTAA